jgi:eukaryotic-like serine/threonine-protein kinase
LTLSPGTRLGAYEVLSPLGAGGMGEVYRARDTRLGREVALKVLPEALARDRERLSRFEQEARAASALNHPNIVTIHEIGREGETAFIAMELVDGKTLRELELAGAMPVRKILNVTSQVAEGLAKAHAAGIVHRDLKPENVMVSKDGFVKVLDFGLAKLVEPQSGEVSAMPTLAPQTTAGTVLGTVGYMSPEQASGEQVDYRSDQFSLGSMLYEMSTGRKAFQRKTPAETMAAIIREEPEPAGGLRPELPMPLRWMLDRCLAKDKDDRYGSTKDLARDLGALRDHLAESGAWEAPATRRLKRLGLSSWAALFAAGAAGTLLTLILVTATREPESLPAYRQLTFRQGAIRSARFSPDGQTVIYSAAWSGEALELFAVRPGAPESRSLAKLAATDLAVSSSGEIALVTRNRYLGVFPGSGMLARMPFEGGASPRDVLENVSFADWSPDGTTMAVVREQGSLQRLEYPLGTLLHETAGWISHPRISRDGRRVAFLNHPIVGDDHGNIIVIDRNGKKTVGATTWTSAWGLCWSAKGSDVWFTAAKGGTQRALRAFSESGEESVLAHAPIPLTLHDIARDGRVLLTRDSIRFLTMALVPGQTQERELSWLDVGLVTDISPDGRKILLNEFGEGGEYSIYLRETDGSPAVRLGPGNNPRFSPDAKWVLTADIREQPPQLWLLPTGPGDPIRVTRDRLEHLDGQFLSDGKRIVFGAGESGRPRRIYVQTVSGDTPTPISPEGVRGSVIGWSVGPVSPDDRYVAASGPDGKLLLYPTSLGDPVPVLGVESNEFPIQWSPDAKSVLVTRPGEPPGRIFRVDPFSGKRELLRQFAPSDPTGVVAIQGVVVTPNADAYAYTYARILSDLYVAEGLN